jgi:uncharacterized protein YwqG
MAIKLTLNQTDRVLFCSSKWWGDPDMPENMQYPTVKVTEEGESYDYPLTFLCQINCEDIAPFDKENKLPHEGMLYFFAAIDKWIGYDSPTENGAGEWSKGHFVVKYAKSINFETFQSCMLVDDEDQALTEREMEITFSECDDKDNCLKLLGNPSSSDVCNKYPELMNFLQIVRTNGLDLEFEGQLNLLVKPSDLGYQNWKKTVAFLND